MNTQLIDPTTIPRSQFPLAWPKLAPPARKSNHAVLTADVTEGDATPFTATTVATLNGFIELTLHCLSQKFFGTVTVKGGGVLTTRDGRASVKFLPGLETAIYTGGGWPTTTQKYVWLGSDLAEYLRD